MDHIFFGLRRLDLNISVHCDVINLAKHELIERVVQHFENVPFSESGRGVFYRIRNAFGQAASEQGISKTIEDAAEFVEHNIFTDVWNSISKEHKATFEALSLVSCQQPRTFLDAAIEALTDGRPGEAIRTIGQIYVEPVPHFAKYRSVLDHGPDRSLAYWQLLNPFYYIWAALPPVKRSPSDLWREQHFNEETQPNTGENFEFNDNDDLLVNFLLEELGNEFWSHAHVLEGGCGNGANARLLMSKVGVNPANYSGFDLHQARVILTKRVAEDLGGKTLPPNAFDNVFQLDILLPEAASTINEHQGCDVVFSSSFTNVFTDTQLLVVIERISKLRPQFIVDISVTTSWSLCIGRYDLSEYYSKFGYRLKSHRLEVPLLGPREAWRLWMPNNYWSNRNILLYERDWSD